MAKKLLITGPPGVGKSTLCDAAARRLADGGQQVFGFVTLEKRDASNQREGFDVVDVANGDRQPLARASAGSQSPGPRVGKYAVDVAAFESIALPALEGAKSSGGVVVMDEVGKMELFSHRFQPLVRDIMGLEDVSIVATVPRRPARGKLPGLVEELRQWDGASLIELTKENRNSETERVISALLSSPPSST